jgi:hypothetical protein
MKLSVINLATTNLKQLGFNFTSLEAWTFLNKSELDIDWMLSLHGNNVNELAINDESRLPCTIQTCFTNEAPYLCLLTNANRSRTILCLKHELNTLRKIIEEPESGVEYSMQYVKDQQLHHVKETALNPSIARKNVLSKLKDAVALSFNLKHYDLPLVTNGQWNIKTSS